MTGVGGPGGVGPKGPTADPAATSAADEAGASESTSAASSAGSAEASAQAGAAQRASIAAGLHGMDALAGEIAAGRLTPRQAIDYLVDAAGVGLEAGEQTQLRELLSDLFANDPHLQSLLDQLGAR
jgi:hypothetical protein